MSTESSTAKFWCSNRNKQLLRMRIRHVQQPVSASCCSSARHMVRRARPQTVCVWLQIDAAPAGDAAPLIALHREVSLERPNTIAALWRR